MSASIREAPSGEHAERVKHLYSHLRHVLALLHGQGRDAGDAIRLQALQHGERAPASWGASCWGGSRGQAEQSQHQGQERCQGPGCHGHARRDGDLLLSAKRRGGCWQLQLELSVCVVHLMKSGRRREVLSHSPRVAPWQGWDPSWSGSGTEPQLYWAAGGAGRRGASGDMVMVVVVGCSLSLPPSLFLSSAMKGGARYRGARVTRHLGERVGVGGGGVSWWWWGEEMVIRWWRSHLSLQGQRSGVPPAARGANGAQKSGLSGVYHAWSTALTRSDFKLPWQPPPPLRMDGCVNRWMELSVRGQLIIGRSWLLRLRGSVMNLMAVENRWLR